MELGKLNSAIRATPHIVISWIIEDDDRDFVNVELVKSTLMAELKRKFGELGRAAETGLYLKTIGETTYLMKECKRAEHDPEPDDEDLVGAAPDADDDLIG